MSRRIVIAVAFLSACVGFFAGVAFGVTVGAKPTRPTATGVVAKPSEHQEERPEPLPRDVFRRLVMGKTPQQVMAALGRPDRTFEASSTYRWTYARRTFDNTSGKVDEAALVEFRNGVVDSILTF